MCGSNESLRKSRRKAGFAYIRKLGNISPMFKSFFLRKMLQSQLKNLPEDQREKILKAVSENPDLFMKIAKEVQEKVKGGRSQQDAMMEVMQAHQDELRGLL